MHVRAVSRPAEAVQRITFYQLSMEKAENMVDFNSEIGMLSN